MKTLLLNLSALAFLTGLFFAYRAATARRRKTDEDQAIRDLHRMAWDLTVKIQQSESSSLLKECDLEVIFLRDTFLGLVSEDALEDQLMRLDQCLAKQRRKLLN